MHRRNPSQMLKESHALLLLPSIIRSALYPSMQDIFLLGMFLRTSISAVRNFPYFNAVPTNAVVQPKPIGPAPEVGGPEAVDLEDVGLADVVHKVPNVPRCAYFPLCNVFLCLKHQTPIS